jgi:hypothetical protein
MRKFKTWTDAAIKELAKPHGTAKSQDYNFRALPGKNGVSLRVRVFPSGNRTQMGAGRGVGLWQCR